MTYERLVGHVLDYAPCQYGVSKLLFRGPKAEPDGNHVAFLGSTETYGKFVEQPFPGLTGQALGVPTVNLGLVNSGIDAIMDDRTILGVCREARLVVLQAMPAQNLSNRMFMVHPRRNDRFLKASATLRALAPGVDFSEITFTTHLMSVLRAQEGNVYDQVVEELRLAWVRRMQRMIRRIETPVVLLWLRRGHAHHGDPGFLTAGMIEELGPVLADRLCLSAERGGAAGTAQDAAIEGGATLVADDEPAAMESAAAQDLPDAAAHRRIAAELAETLRTLL